MSSHSDGKIISTRNITIAGVVSLLSLLATLGFTSPREQVSEVKRDVKAVEERVSKHDVQFAVQDQKISYIMDGIDDLRGLSIRERRARRTRHE